MPQPEDAFLEPDGEEVRYDLAGNPLPSRPKPAAAPPPLPPGSPAAPPAFTPPPGALRPPGPSPAWGGPASAPKPAPSGPGLYAGLGIAVVLLVALIFGVRALRPVMVPMPASYKTYTAIDNTFSCDQPSGWTMHETGATSGVLSTVTFEQSHVRVRVISDAIGSLMGDISRPPPTSESSIPGMPPPPPPKPVVEKLHEMDKAQLARDMPDYKEGDMQMLSSRVGDARLSEWTADGGKLHGYRVTMLGSQREITVICISPERNWTVIQPAFQRLIHSVVPGNG